MQDVEAIAGTVPDVDKEMRRAVAKRRRVLFQSPLVCELNRDGTFDDATGSVTITTAGDTAVALRGLAPQTLYLCGLLCATPDGHQAFAVAECGPTTAAGRLRANLKGFAHQEGVGLCLEPALIVVDAAQQLKHVCLTGLE